MEINTTRDGDVVTTTIKVTSNQDFLDNVENFEDALDNCLEPDEQDVLSIEFTYRYRNVAN